MRGPAPKGIDRRLAELACWPGPPSASQRSGSNVAARNARPEGTVLGALVGAGVGAAVGNASAKCDTRGAYYSYEQTQPYRYSDGRYADSGERCRLAPAPTEYNGRVETRYVRVCPDADGRYRVQG